MSLPAEWARAVANAIAYRAEQSSLRSRRPVGILDSTHVEIDGRRLINFASNDYLGLTHHPRVIQAFRNTAGALGVGSGAAALITGQSDIHASAERALARWKNTESAVILSSGYAANLAAVQMLVGVGRQQNRRVRFLIDKLLHASLVDAVRSVANDEKITFRVFPHNHLGKLRRLLEDRDNATLQVVVTESIFSMDGDAADLPGIVALKRDFPFLLLLDEAHGSGVYGLHGAGYAAELGLAEAVDLTVVTLSKAIGCVGGAICASRPFCEAIVNFGRPYIFSTALPAAIAAAAESAIGVMHDEPRRQSRLRKIARHLRGKLNLPSGDSPIVPIVLGSEIRAIQAAERLTDFGILTVAVRPPTVPRGTSRLRLTLSCDHTDQELETLIQSLARMV